MGRKRIPYTFTNGLLELPDDTDPYIIDKLLQVATKVDDTSVAADNHICNVCGFEAKSISGLQSHTRNKHKEV